jgi:hypothetical protein
MKQTCYLQCKAASFETECVENDLIQIRGWARRRPKNRRSEVSLVLEITPFSHRNWQAVKDWILNRLDRRVSEITFDQLCDLTTRNT